MVASLSVLSGLTRSAEHVATRASQQCFAASSLRQMPCLSEPEVTTIRTPSRTDARAPMVINGLRTSSVVAHRNFVDDPVPCRHQPRAFAHSSRWDRKILHSSSCRRWASRILSAEERLSYPAAEHSSSNHDPTCGDTCLPSRTCIPNGEGIALSGFSGD